MSTVNYDQLGRFVAKRKFSLDAIETLRSIAITLNEEGDTKGAIAMDRVLEMQFGIRVHLGLPLEHKLGGMDRQGVS